MSEEKGELDRELKFLQESLDAGVITESEFSRAKERIDKRLKNIEESEIKKNSLDTSEIDRILEEADPKEDSEVEIKEVKEEDTYKIELPQKEDSTIEKDEKIQEKKQEEGKEISITQEKNTVQEKEEPKPEIDSPKEKETLDTTKPKPKPEIDSPKEKETLDTTKPKPEIDSPKEKETLDTTKPKPKPEIDSPKEKETLDTTKPKPKPKPEIDSPKEEPVDIIKENTQEESSNIQEKEQEEDKIIPITQIPIAKKEKPVQEKEEPEPKLEIDSPKEEDSLKEEKQYTNDFDTEPTKKRKIWRWIAIIVIFLLIYNYWPNNINGSDEDHVSRNTDSNLVFEEEDPIYVCVTDDDCVLDGKESMCLDGGTDEAECVYNDMSEINLTIINTEECFNCDTKRVYKILKNWFKGLTATKIDSGSEEGKVLIKEHNIELLPAYILSSNVGDTFKFKDVSRIFVESGDSYVLSRYAAGSTYYLSRGEISKTIDLFVIKNDSPSLKAENSLLEFTDSFGNDVTFMIYFVEKGDERSEMAKELGIKILPAFIVNNKILFSGVHSPNTIKENFCSMNQVDKCGSELRKNLE